MLGIRPKDKAKEAVFQENPEKLQPTKGDNERNDSNDDKYGVLRKLYVQKNEAYILGTHRTGIIINEKIWECDDANKVCWFVQCGSLAGSKIRRQPWNEIQDKWKELRRP